MRDHEHDFDGVDPTHLEQAICAICGLPYDELGPFAKRKVRQYYDLHAEVRRIEQLIGESR